MSDDRQQRRKKAEARLERVAENLGEALNARDQAVRETARDISRRRAGEVVGLSRSRVQQIINAPWTHRVTFTGRLSLEAAEALKAAGLDLRVSRGGGSVGPSGEFPPMLKHSIYVTAKNGKEAKGRVEAALEGFGPLHDFRAETVSPV